MAEDEKLLKEAKKLPWEDRLAHKNWKVRVDANSDICVVCDGISDPKDQRLKEFGPLFRKSIADSNASAQEKALEALIAFLRVVDADSARFSKEICDAVVVKCLTGRPKTVEKAQAVLLLWVELEATETFLDAMEKAVKNKVAKAVVLAIDAMYQAVSQFGTKVVPPKKILKMLPELFDHQDQNVRAAAKGLTIELCRWIGKDTVKSILFEKMRETMKKELEAEVDNVVGGSKPSRKIRSEQVKEGSELEAASEVIAIGAVDDASAIGVEETDEYELVDPVDILGPLAKSVFWEGVKASKWSERRDAVAELTRLASAKRLAAGDYVEVSRMLKKLITDVNLAVAVEAVQAAGNLARGLRKDYSGGSKGLLPLLLERFKEKKPMMVDALTQTLQTMYGSGCFTLADVVEDVKNATKNKVPSVRSQCLTWVGQCTESSNKATIMKQYKEYVPILMESLSDGTPEVRDAAFGAVAALVKFVGLKPLEKSLEKLDDIKRKRLTDLIGVNSSVASAPNGVSAPPKAVSANGGVLAADDVAISGNRSAASLLSGNKVPSQGAKKIPNGKTSTVKKSDATLKQSKSAANVHEDTDPGEVSVEDIESQFTTHFDAEIVTNLRSSVWKERLEGVLTLQTKVESMPNVDSLVLMLVRFLSVLPGWSEKNVQVQQKMMEIIAKLSETSSSFSKRCVVLCLPGVVERISDVKTRIQATRCLTAFCESVEPEFVVRKLLEAWKDHKNPKVVSEGLSWMVSALEDFGPGHIPVKDVIEFCKDVALQSSAAPTRNAAVKVIGALHKSCGPDIKLYFSDVKPAVQTLVNAECEKNPFTGENILPKRVTRASNNAGKGSGGGTDALPREDISSKLTPALMKNFTSVDWKLRQESLEAIGTILQEANMRIQPNGTLELLGTLKGRLSDSNKNLVIIALSTLGKLALALGPTFEKNLKLIHLDVLKCLGDNKKLTREAAIKTLDAWLVVVPLGRLLPYVVPAILELKLCADGRKDLFEWMLKNAGRLDNQADVTLLMKPISSGVQDKNAEVRKAAESLFSEMTKSCGGDMINKATKSLQGPALAALLSLMDRCRVSSDSNYGKESSMDETLKGPPARQVPGNRIASRGVVGLSRGAGVRASVTKIPKQEAVVAAMDAAVQGQTLFNLKDSNKEEREKSILRRSKFEEPRADQAQDVEVDFLKYFREDIHRRMLSPDFRKQVEGVDILQRAIPGHYKEMIEVLDVLLRWIVLRVCESNTICLLKVLDFLQDLFTALGDDGYLLTDWEAANIFPCLVEKSGHNIEKVREKMRDLMRLLCSLYRPSKIFVYITEGLRSKNNRSRIECVEHIGFLIERYGIEVGGPGKCLQGVVAVTTERDGDLRKASLQTLATAYQILGDDVWKYLGKLSDMQRSLLDEKFKWKAREMDKGKIGTAGDFRGLRRLPDDNAVESAEHSGESGSGRSGTPSHNSGPFQTNAPVSSMIQPVGPVDWREAIVVIETASVSEKAVDGMKVICYELGQAVGDVEGGLLDELAESVDELVRSLTTRVSKSFKAWLSGASLRACKYVLNTVMQTFQVKKLACEVKENTLHALITELLLWLLDDRVPLLDDGSHILKALNVLMLKILENANRTSAFVVLIDLLHPSFGISKSAIPYPQESFLSSQRFSELVVKCLIKLTKVLGSTINEVDLDRLLQSIHECFQQLGLEEIRKRAGADDKPLRMVKTILHELVKLRGTAIKGHLSMVPIDSEPQPIILAYIDLNLQTLAASRVLAPTVTGSQVHWLDSGGNGPDSTPSSSAETQLKQELAAIFKKIGDKQTSTIGLYELYRITQLYPQVDIFSQLQNASMAFRTYIRDGLAQMEKSAATGRTPITSTFVSPPPLSSSPAQLQPKAALANSDANGNSFSNTCTDDSEMGSVGLSSSELESSLHRRVSPQASNQGMSQRSSDFLSAPVPEVQGGTLNAIRERMKNIQAAAAGNAGSFGIHSLGSSEVVVPRSSVSVDVSTQQIGEPISDKALSGLQARMERLKSGVIDPAY